MLIIVMAVAACRPSVTSAVLADVESYIDSHPDSALATLSSIDPETIRTKSQKGQFSLLYAMALDKNYVDTSDVSVIQPALDYYSGTDDAAGLMKTYYYLGRIQQNAGDKEEAIRTFSKALDISEKTDDDFFKGMINSIISNLYSSKLSSEEALYYARKAYEHMMKTPDTYRQWVLFGRLAVCYGDNREKATADSLFQIYRTMPVLDTAVYAKNLAYYSKMLLSRKPAEPQRSIDVFNETRSKYKYKPRLEDYYFYAAALDKTGRTEESGKLLSRLEQLDTLSTSSKNWRYIIYKNKKDYRKALSLLEQTVNSQDSLIIKNLRQSLEKAQKEFFAEKARNAEHEKEKTTFKLMLAAGLLIILILSAILTFLIYRRRQERRIELLETVREELINRLRVHEEKSKMHYKLLDNLCEAYFHDTYKAQKDRVYEQVTFVLSKLTSSDGKISEIERLANQDLDGIVTKLREDVPNLSEKAYQFFAYDALGFSSKTIAVILGTSPVSVYTRRARIKEKIQQLPPEKRSRYQM